MTEQRTFAEQAWEKLSRLLGVSDAKFTVINRPTCDTIGVYYGWKKEIVVNLAKLRTKRDVLFVVAHEARHAWQHKHIGTENFVQLVVQSSDILSKGNVINYNLSVVEVDANTFAFDYENGLTYNNKVYHKRFPSMFLDLKEMHHNFDQTVFSLISQQAKRIFR